MQANRYSIVRSKPLILIVLFSFAVLIGSSCTNSLRATDTLDQTNATIDPYHQAEQIIESQECLTSTNDVQVPLSDITGMSTGISQQEEGVNPTVAPQNTEGSSILLTTESQEQQSLAAAEQIQSVTGDIYYVAKSGDDKYEGTYDKPWLTLAHAMKNLRPGDTLYLREGIYNEKILIEQSGTSTAPITITSYPNENAVLDGTGVLMSSSMDAMIFIYDQSYIHIEGLEIRNFSTSEQGTCIGGILVEGNCNGIELRNNIVHHIQNLAVVDGDRNGRDAHGIAVYGSSTQTITGLKIIGNTISDCKLGSSEALAVNGNISGFTVSGNLVFNNDNIGIAFIGYEGVCPSSSIDRARNGVCENNIVHHIDSYGNPAYGTDQSADGIYCDGATKITITDNIVHHANFGIELASEHAGKDASFITVENNFVCYCTNAGLAMGGYDTDRGSSFSNTVRHNTFLENDTSNGGFGEIYLQYRATNNVIEKNLIIASDQGIFVCDVYSTNSGNLMSANIYFSSVGRDQSIWIWRGEELVGFDEYREATGNDKYSMFCYPMFREDNGKTSGESVALATRIDAGRQ